jgi:hypothetical protein
MKNEFLIALRENSYCSGCCKKCVTVVGHHLKSVATLEVCRAFFVLLSSCSLSSHFLLVDLSLRLRSRHRRPSATSVRKALKPTPAPLALLTPIRAVIRPTLLLILQVFPQIRLPQVTTEIRPLHPLLTTNPLPPPPAPQHLPASARCQNLFRRRP